MEREGNVPSLRALVDPAELRLSHRQRPPGCQPPEPEMPRVRATLRLARRCLDPGLHAAASLGREPTPFKLTHYQMRPGLTFISAQSTGFNAHSRGAGRIQDGALVVVTASS